MPQIGSNFEYSGRNPLDARQQCESLEILKTNEKNILYPPGFEVFCLLENKKYKNISKLNENPVWEEIDYLYLIKKIESQQQQINELIEKINNINEKIKNLKPCHCSPYQYLATEKGFCIGTEKGLYISI